MGVARKLGEAGIEFRKYEPVPRSGAAGRFGGGNDRTNGFQPKEPLAENREGKILHFPIPIKSQDQLQDSKPKTSVSLTCEAYERQRMWAVCETNELPAKEIYLKQVEEVALRLGHDDQTLGAIVIRADKKGLNHLNKTGGKNGAGDACLELYMDTLKESAIDAYPLAKKIFFIRDSPASDETTIVILAENQYIEMAGICQFKKSYSDVLRKKMSMLDQYKYIVRKSKQSDEKKMEGEPVRLDLARFSAHLTNPELVAAAHICGPHFIEPGEIKSGFITLAMEKLGIKEQVDPSNLPAGFSPRFAKRVSLSPFTHTIPISGPMPSGSIAIEIKFSHLNDVDRNAPLSILEKTKKGAAEIYSSRFGLRYINTYMGEQVADHILHAVGLAMKDIEFSMKCKIMKTDSKLMFVVGKVDNDGKAELEKKLDDAIRKRIGNLEMGEPCGFVPSLSVLEASGVHANDLRSLMALHSLDSAHLPTSAITYVDFLVAAVRSLKVGVFSEAVFNPTKSDFRSMRLASNVLATIQFVCEKDSAVRDAEDLIWAIRNGNLGISSEIEKEIWEFAIQSGKEVRDRLIEIMAKL